MPDTQKIRALVYYAIDLCSPRELSKSPTSDTLAKIAHDTFAELGIIDSDVDDVWQTLNAQLPTAEYGGKKIPAAVSKKCKTPQDIWDAVWTAAGVTPAPPM